MWKYVLLFSACTAGAIYSRALIIPAVWSLPKYFAVVLSFSLPQNILNKNVQLERHVWEKADPSL